MPYLCTGDEIGDSTAQVKDLWVSLCSRTHVLYTCYSPGNKNTAQQQSGDGGFAFQEFAAPGGSPTSQLPLYLGCCSKRQQHWKENLNLVNQLLSVHVALLTWPTGMKVETGRIVFIDPTTVRRTVSNNKWEKIRLLFVNYNVNVYTLYIHPSHLTLQ